MRSKILITALLAFHTIFSTAAQPADTAVAGRVTDPDGNPVSGARLRIVGWEGGPRYSDEGRSNTTGAFQLKAQPGSGRLFVHADGYASMYRTHDVVEGMNGGWDFRLVRSAKVSGQVVDTKGKPVPGRVLELSSIRQEAPPAPGVGIYSTGGEHDTGPDGTFALPNVAPGRYTVTVYKPSPFGGDRCMQQIPVKGDLLEVNPSDIVKNFQIVLHPAEDYYLGGHVRDKAGKPLAGVVVDTYIPHGRHWWTRTDKQGSFRIEGLDGMGISRFKLHFEGFPCGGDKAAIPDVPLNSGNVSFILPGKGAVEGTVRNRRTGEVIRSFEIKVPVVKDPVSGAVWEDPGVQADLKGDGTFKITGIPAGEATVEIRAESLGAQRFLSRVEADTTTALSCEMAGPAVFAGRTTMNGKPKGIGVILADEWLNSAGDGTFRFDKFPNGEYTVWFFESDGRHRTAEVCLKSGETTQLDMDVGGSCEVRGTVRFPEDEPFCSVRLAAKAAPDGWFEFGRPSPEEYVLTWTLVSKSGGEYKLTAVPPGSYFLMAGRYRSSMHRSLPGISKKVELKEGETLSIDLDLTGPEPTAVFR